MTFYEAAVEVLREAGRPLHYKKITEISVKRSLLSHVGKTPEITMGARLEIEAGKAGTDTLLVRVRPGVYSLREGADVAEAAQTIRPRGYTGPEEADEFGTDDAEPAADAQETDTAVAADEGATDEAPATAGAAAAAPSGNGKRRRRRGRRGGRGRERDGEGEAGDTDAVEADGDDADGLEADGYDADDSDEAAADAAVAPATDAAPVATAPVADGRGDLLAALGSRAESAAPAPAAEADAELTTTVRIERPRRDAPRPEPAREAARPEPSRAPRPLAPRGGPTPGGAPGPESGDIARAMIEILSQRAGDGGLHARSIAADLAAMGVAGLGRIGPAVVRDHIEFANATRARAGRPPLFEEPRPNQWALAAASGSALARSYDALDAWHAQHRAALRAALSERLRGLGREGLASVVGLTLDRLGYRGIRTEEPAGSELGVLVASTPRALTAGSVVVSILPNGVEATRADVERAIDRMRAHGAANAAIIAPGGVAADASVAASGAVSTIELLDAAALCDHMLAAGVGVSAFHVQVRCVDEALFRDLPEDS